MTSLSSIPSAQTDSFVHERLPPADQWPQFDYSQLPDLQIAPQSNLVEVLFARAMQNGHADRPMLRSDRITLSYADAQARVNRI